MEEHDEHEDHFEGQVIDEELELMTGARSRLAPGQAHGERAGAVDRAVVHLDDGAQVQLHGGWRGAVLLRRPDEYGLLAN